MPVDITNRIAIYKRKTSELYADDPMDFHCRYMSGIAIQKRVTQGKRKLSIVRTHTAKRGAVK